MGKRKRKPPLSDEVKSRLKFLGGDSMFDPETGKSYKIKIPVGDQAPFPGVGLGLASTFAQLSLAEPVQQVDQAQHFIKRMNNGDIFRKDPNGVVTKYIGQNSEGEIWERVGESSGSAVRTPAQQKQFDRKRRRKMTPEQRGR